MRQARTLTGRHVLFIFLAFFITVTGVNALMVTYAIKTFSGEDVAAAYVKGLNYNAALAARETEARSGYLIDASAVRVNGTTRITANVRRKGAEMETGLQAIATLRHPTNAHLDRTVILSGGNGAFTASVDGLPTGQWDLVIALHSHGVTIYEARTRAWLR